MSVADESDPRNWKTFDEQTMDFCQGITLHHLPGHTDGSSYLTKKRP